MLQLHLRINPEIREGGEKREGEGDFDECSDHFAINKEISDASRRRDATHRIANQDATQLRKIQFACQEDKYITRKF